MANEKRLISAEQAYEVARLHHHDFAQSIADLTSLRGVLEDCDTVDAVEVVHGRWLTWEEKFPGVKPRRSNNLGVFCDKCHNHADNRTYFCPNCGANMKGE